MYLVNNSLKSSNFASSDLKAAILVRAFPSLLNWLYKNVIGLETASAKGVAAIFVRSAISNSLIIWSYVFGALMVNCRNCTLLTDR